MKLKFKYATLVYQAGIANVFSHNVDLHARRDEPEPKGTVRERLLQSDFRTCYNYACGLAAAGVIVRKAWCNMAGDIAGERWNFSNFENAPFNDEFGPSFGN